MRLFFLVCLEEDFQRQHNYTSLSQRCRHDLFHKRQNHRAFDILPRQDTVPELTPLNFAHIAYNVCLSVVILATV